MKHDHALLAFIIFVFFLTGCASKTPLIKASQAGDSTMVKKIVREGADVNTPDSKGTTPLIHAVMAGNIEMVRTLIDIGADINKPDKYGYTPLYWASSYGYLDIVMLLINKNANVNARSDDQYSALLAAVGSNNIEIVNVLINKGADINIKNNVGATPLMQAAMYGNYEGSKLLIEKGADLFTLDVSGHKASDFVNRKNKALLKLFIDEEFKQIMSGQLSVKYPLQSKLFPIIYKVGKCVNPDVNYNVFIVNAKEANASVNLSGNIAFTEPAVKKWDDDTLIFVAAHEISHDKLGHVSKKLTVSYGITTAMLVANAFVPGVGYLNHLINPAVTNNYSKTHEYDADKLASEYCLKCFNMPIEKQVEIMQYLKSESGNGGGLWANHPSWDDRIKNIEENKKTSVPKNE